MAVKIFCNACHKFIKDATKNEIHSLTGNEICESCEQGVKSAFDEIDKASKRAIVQIETLRDKKKSELEQMAKKVIKADDD